MSYIVGTFDSYVFLFSHSLVTSFPSSLMYLLLCLPSTSSHPSLCLPPLPFILPFSFSFSFSSSLPRSPLPHAPSSDLLVSYHTLSLSDIQCQTTPWLGTRRRAAREILGGLPAGRLTELSDFGSAKVPSHFLFFSRPLLLVSCDS